MRKKIVFSPISKLLGVIGISLLAFTLFVSMGKYNYVLQREIQRRIVYHPESLATKEMAAATSFGFKNMSADWYWLRTIQYIGGNAISSEYKKYLYKVLELVTELNPYFEHPYIIGELLLPSYSDRYENLDEKEQKRNLEEAEKIGLLGVENFCDIEKVQRIRDEYDLKKLWTKEEYKNPCKSYEIPFYLAYIYYFYKHDPLTAAWYYKVASANESAPQGAKVMSAIMQGKGGSREKSIFMFLNLAKSFETENLECQQLNTSLENLATAILQKKIRLNGLLLQEIQSLQSKIFGSFDESKESGILSDTTCQNYVMKAVREINLMYIESGNEAFKKAHEGTSANNAKILFKEKYIDFLPTDFQQYDDYGIIYEYNPETKNFDYGMGKYEE